MFAVFTVEFYNPTISSAVESQFKNGAVGGAYLDDQKEKVKVGRC